MQRIGMGLVGAGFVGIHHIDAVRRLGFVDVVAIAGSDEERTRAKADALGIPKAYGSFKALAADRDVHVVHNATPNHLHGPVIRAALAHGKHIVSEKPLASSADETLVRFEGGARGVVSVGQVCAGHKNDLWLELSGAIASLRWRQEQQNELWIGRRDDANLVMAKDPALLNPESRRYAHLPGGDQEEWSDAFFNVLRDVYAAVALKPSDRPPAAFATFEDGYRVACLIDAVLDSHRRGGVWTGVHASALTGSVR
jgi:predicted dehydrogenase